MSSQGRAPRAEPRPLPWRRMAWVTWRHHRLALAGTAALVGAPSAFLVLSGLPMHDAFSALTRCRPARSAACGQLAHDFLNAHVHSVLGTAGLLQTVVVLIGAFAGGRCSRGSSRPPPSATRGRRASDACAGRSPSWRRSPPR